MNYRAFAVAVAAVITFSASAAAQEAAPKLETGKWTGKVTPPDGETVNVTYDVAYAGDTLKITINAASHGTFQTTETKLEGTKLSFKFRPGPEVVCVLEKKEADYIGACTDEGGGVAQIELSPPKKEAK
jgi:hypothetical protein